MSEQGESTQRFADGPGDGAFDGVESGEGYSNYAGVDMSGPDGPVKAGVPSSGNWQMPDWMKQDAGEGPGGGFNVDEAYDKGGFGRTVLLVFVGLLFVALIAGVAVYFLRSSGSTTPPKSTSLPSAGSLPEVSVAPGSSVPPAGTATANTPLQKFTGTHSKAAGTLTDSAAGLSYAKLGAPWQVPGKKSPLYQDGWTGRQVATTASQPGQTSVYAQLMSGSLAAKGTGGQRAVATAYAQTVQVKLYPFPFKAKLIASQPLKPSGAAKKGWLLGYQITYHRDGVKATGETLVIAVFDTGRTLPASLVMTVPSTEKKLLPDVNFVVDSLKVVH